MLILMIVIFLLIMLIIVIYVFLNYKQKKDNFLNNELLSDSCDRDNWDNLEFKNIEIEKFLSNKPKYKDIDELMNETKEGETIYDITSVKLKNK